MMTRSPVARLLLWAGAGPHSEAWGVYRLQLGLHGPV